MPAPLRQQGRVTKTAIIQYLSLAARRRLWCHCSLSFEQTTQSMTAAYNSVLAATFLFSQHYENGASRRLNDERYGEHGSPDSNHHWWRGNLADPTSCSQYHRPTRPTSIDRPQHDETNGPSLRLRRPLVVTTTSLLGGASRFRGLQGRADDRQAALHPHRRRAARYSECRGANHSYGPEIVSQHGPWLTESQATQLSFCPS